MTDRFAAAVARRRGTKCLVVYLTAGDPDNDTALACADACIRAGADILEIGVPFSDPVADGPVIQQAMQRALTKGGGLRGALSLAAELRRRHPSVPLLLFGYANPLLARGFEDACRKMRLAGVDGVLMVDMPSEEAGDLQATATAEGIAWISLVAPTTGKERTQTIAAAAQGFLYAVSMTGVTGGAVQDLSAVERLATWVREVSAIPIMVGFGVRDAVSAERAARCADGVVVGSAVIRALEDGGPEAAAALVAEIRRGLDHDA